MNQTKTNFHLFGGEIEIIAYDLDSTQGQYILENIHMEALRLEKIFNPYDNKSEFFKLDKDRQIKPSKELFEMLMKSSELFEKFKEDTSVGCEDGFTAEDLFISRDLIKILDSSLHLDLKNLSKGYIVDLLIKEMKEEGIVSGFVDVKGDIITYGERYEIVEIPSPRNNDFEIIGIKLEDSSISTFHNHEAKEYTSISVIGKTLLESEFYSTRLSNLDIEKIKLFCDKNNNIKTYIRTSGDEEIDFNGFLEMERIIKIQNKVQRKTRAS